MRTLQPLFRDFPGLENRLSKGFIGFDEMFRDIFEDTGAVTQAHGYPPHNIEKLGDNQYRLTLAVAGFNEDDIDISLQNGMLTITGEKVEKSEDERDYIYKGIAQRAFRRQFKLGEHVEVENAELDNGLLVVDLTRQVPEEEKAKRIPIQSKGKALGHDSKSKAEWDTEQDKKASK